jgi:hypothetical protein
MLVFCSSNFQKKKKNWGSLSTQQNILINLRMQIAENGFLKNFKNIYKNISRQLFDSKSHQEVKITVPLM